MLMPRKVFYGICLAIFSYSSLLSGANGLNMIGVTAKSRSMGGTGVSHYSSPAQAQFKNPALLGWTDAEQMEFGLDLMRLTVNLTGDALVATTKEENEADNAPLLIPVLGYSYKLNQDFAFGIAFLPYGGASVDHTGANTLLLSLKTHASFIRVTPTASYNLNEEWSFGISPYLFMGELGLEFDPDGAAGPAGQTNNGKKKANTFGYQFGVAWKAMPELALGLVYISSNTVIYDELADLETLRGAAPDGVKEDVELQQPAEFAIGATYSLLEMATVSFDIRQVQWGNTVGYGDLGWENATAFALGGQYFLTEEITLRLGYQYSASPVSDESGENGTETKKVLNKDIPKSSISLLNAVGIPGYSTTDYTFGAGYKIMENFDVNLSVAIAPEEQIERKGTTVTAAAPTTPINYQYIGTISGNVITIGMNYKM